MSDIILGIGDFLVTNEPETVLKTYSLGSCVAIILYDESSKTGGMAHIALSNSRININKSKRKPAYFADTGLSVLLSSFKKFNSSMECSKLKAYLVGGASVAKMEDFFKIGENNIKAIKEKLKSYGIHVTKEDCGKNISRTVSFDIEKNCIEISNHLLGTWEL